MALHTNVLSPTNHDGSFISYFPLRSEGVQLSAEKARGIGLGWLMAEGASSSSSSSSQAVQTPEQAAEALRQFGEAQHSHSEVIESLAGQADEVDDDEDESLGVCNAEEVLQAYARCREAETIKTYRSAVTAFTNWLVLVKDNHEVKTMVAKILKCSGEPPTYTLDFKELAKSLEGPANLYCRYTLSFQKAANHKNKSGLGHIKNLRSGLSNEFLDNRVELSSLAINMLRNWTRSRKRDDMKARTRPNNPIKFSNATWSTPA